MQNFRIGREGFQQLKQLPQVFLHKMVGVKCNVKETEVLAREDSQQKHLFLLIRTKQNYTRRDY